MLANTGPHFHTQNWFPWVLTCDHVTWIMSWGASQLPWHQHLVFCFFASHPTSQRGNCASVFRWCIKQTTEQSCKHERPAMWQIIIPLLDTKAGSTHLFWSFLSLSPLVLFHMTPSSSTTRDNSNACRVFVLFLIYSNIQLHFHYISLHIKSKWKERCVLCGISLESTFLSCHFPGSVQNQSLPPPSLQSFSVSLMSSPSSKVPLLS